MRRVGVEAAGEAAPYLGLIRQVLPPEAGEPDENGFIAVKRGDLRGSVARRAQELAESQDRVPGDSQLLVVLSKASDLKGVRGLAILNRPGVGTLWECLEFRTLELARSKDNSSELLSAPINRLDSILHNDKVRLSIIHMFGFFPEAGSIGSENAVSIQESEKEISAEIEELGMSHPGAQPFNLQYLIRFDN